MAVSLDLVQVVDVAIAMLGQGLVQNFSYHAFLGRLVDLVSRKQYGEEDKEPDWRGQNQRDDLVLMIELLDCLHFFFLLEIQYLYKYILTPFIL